MCEYFIPVTKTDTFLNPSHASFTALGWANFLSPLTKTDKFLNSSHASLTNLGWANILSPLIKIDKFLNPCHASFYRFGIRISIDQTSYASVKNSRTFQSTNVHFAIFDREF